ncbi:MAG: response regulator [Acidobacteria bacterium]|nr:response regulator [Acidobacteriota bacterium]
MRGRASEAITVSLPNPRILLVDDDISFLRGLRDYFSASGYDVDTARTPEEALQLIQEAGTRSYQLVITDLDFGDLSQIEGDQFLLQNLSLFRGALTAVISGTSDLTVDRRLRLEEAEIHFLQKSPETAGKLEEIAEEAKQRRATDIAAILAEVVTPRVEERIGGLLSIEIMPLAAPSVASRYADVLKGVVIDWLKAREDLDAPIFMYGTQVYSANELAEEVRRETKVGLAHVALLLDEFQSFLGKGQDGKAGNGDDEV